MRSTTPASRPHDVDGLVKFTMERTVEVEIARNLGLPNLRFFGEVGYGGGAGCGAVGHAAMAIATGMAEVVVVWRARLRGSGGRPWASKSNRVGDEFQWFLPWGLSRPVDQIAMLTRRHMHELGSTEEHLGAVATAFREHAQQQPLRDDARPDDDRGLPAPRGGSASRCGCSTAAWSPTARWPSS